MLKLLNFGSLSSLQVTQPSVGMNFKAPCGAVQILLLCCNIVNKPLTTMKKTQKQKQKNWVWAGPRQPLPTLVSFLKVGMHVSGAPSPGEAKRPEKPPAPTPAWPTWAAAAVALAGGRVNWAPVGPPSWGPSNLELCGPCSYKNF